MDLGVKAIQPLVVILLFDSSTVRRETGCVPFVIRTGDSQPKVFAERFNAIAMLAAEKELNERHELWYRSRQEGKKNRIRNQGKVKVEKGNRYLGHS